MTRSMLATFVLVSSCPAFVAGRQLQSQSAQQTPSPSALSTAIHVGVPVEDALKGGEFHSYSIQLEEGQYLEAIVDQRGIDVVVRLFRPDNNLVLEVDSPNGTVGPEPVSAVADTAGSYRLEVRSLEPDAEPGHYELRLSLVRPATERDRTLDKARALDSRVEQLRAEGKHSEAIPIAEQALALREQVLGTVHPSIAVTLVLLGDLYQRVGNYERAIPSYRRALAIDEELFGPKHLDVARLLNKIGLLLDDQADYAEALLCYERALDIQEHALGADDSHLATTLNNIANVYQAQGDYARAESFFLRTISIYEKALGPEHTGVALALSNLAVLYGLQGRYVAAIPLALRALRIREKALGADHIDVAFSLQTVGKLYEYQGKYVEALPLYSRAAQIFERAVGPNSPQLAGLDASMGSIYQTRGDFVKAEPLELRALAIREKALGPDHPDVASTLLGIATLYRSQGRFESAEPLLKRALAIREKAFGPNHPDVASSLNALGQAFLSQGDYEEAEPLFLRALAIRQKAFGAANRNVAEVLNNLATLSQFKGDSAKALERYGQALAIYEKALGPDHRDVAAVLSNIASAYRSQGRYSEAIALLTRSLAIREKALGANHPRVATTLDDMSGVFWAMGDITNAVVCEGRGNGTRELELVTNLASGSERRKYAYLQQTASELDYTVSLHVRSAIRSIPALRAALEIILRRKGRALDAMTDQVALLRQRSNPEDQKLLDDLSDARSQLSTLTLRGPGKEGVDQYRANVTEVQARVESLESQVASRSAEFRAASQPITLDAVQKAIPADARLVEFASYRPYDPKKLTYGDRRYVVYVLGSTGAPVWADLGPASIIDGAVDSLRRVIKSGKSSPAAVRSAARRLDQLVMRPVRRLAGTTMNLLLSPDGALNLVPFAALVDERGRYLVERYRLSYLTSGRDLLRLQVERESHSETLLLANPDYGLKAAAPSTERKLELDGSPIPDYSRMYFRPLAGTAEEARLLGPILPNPRILVEGAATESELKSAAAPEILHIATHGFFLPEKLPTKPSASDDLSRSLVLSGENRPTGPPIENPLLRSGLALAGANTHEGGGDDDGILTALEVAGLNLWGTKLVVLSACDTGVGEVKTGDGVYGLRRALVLAGAETEMMSLWPVSDTGTRDLMVDFYKTLLEGKGRAEALRDVQLRMLADPNHKHPFFWASFILSGQWGQFERNQ